MTIGRKVRFQVLSRDKFTCQYCGRKAPDVALEVDHIHPKSKDGSNWLTNLLTACVDCNGGKSDILLDGSHCVSVSAAQMEKAADDKSKKVLEAWVGAFNQKGKTIPKFMDYEWRQVRNACVPVDMGVIESLIVEVAENAGGGSWIRPEKCPTASFVSRLWHAERSARKSSQR